MLRGTARALRTVSRISQLNQAPSECSISHRPWVGCSHWTTPFRPLNPFSTSTQSRLGTVRDKNLDRSSSLREDLESNVDREDVWDNGNAEDVGIETSLEGIIVDQVDPSDSDHTQSQGDENNTSKDKPPPTSRPQLPTSIKKLNRLLSHSREISIPESDLIETFVRGRGPGGQAINKTNSSVSLIHIPTGIRIQSQPTRSREENRKIARKILGERLDLIRARATATAKAGPQGEREGEGAGVEVKTRKEKEKILAGQWSRDEIRWEKERRRKSNKAKKAKKKHGVAGSAGTDPGQGGGVGAE